MSLRLQSVEHTSSCTPQRRGEGRGRVERRGERGEKERRGEGEGGRGGGGRSDKEMDR